MNSRPIIAAVVCALSASAFGENGFEPIFDGRTLAGWETPDPSYWSVEDGAITGRITAEHPCALNQYLVWSGGELADFELKLASRLEGEGGINNGFQFRSRVLPDHDVCGYQVDNNLQTPWLVRLYDEYGRHTLAMRGERTEFDANGTRVTIPIDASRGAAWFRLEEWHEYHLICVGPKITLRVNGRVAAEVTDNDLRRQELQGALALQLHSGPRTTVQFKDIRLKVLKAAEQSEEGALSVEDRRRADLLDQATAWWPLDTGGHGAVPALRHIPGWSEFELNVKAAGPGARAGAKVALLDGAHFEAEPGFFADTDRLTVFLRARDPGGEWDATLLSKGEGEAVAFRLLGRDSAEPEGRRLAFEARTDEGLGQVAFPLSAIAADAWHDLAARYDGSTLSLFCDGRLLASAPWSGALARTPAPILIGAEERDGEVARHFRGELEEAALWARALTDEEIAALSRRH